MVDKMVNKKMQSSKNSSYLIIDCVSQEWDQLRPGSFNSQSQSDCRKLLNGVQAQLKIKLDLDLDLTFILFSNFRSTWHTLQIGDIIAQNIVISTFTKQCNDCQS